MKKDRPHVNLYWCFDARLRTLICSSNWSLLVLLFLASPAYKSISLFGVAGDVTLHGVDNENQRALEHGGKP